MAAERRVCWNYDDAIACGLMICYNFAGMLW